jgi:5'-nucleotidase
MCKALNLIGLHYSVVGNHDLDFGVDRLVTLIDHCNNKWLLSNLFDKQTDKPLAGALPYDLTEWNGIKIGLIGLVEESWIQTLGRVDPETVRYVDYIEEGKRLAKELKEKGAELVFALTHVRLDNDIALANQVPEIDAIIGGHDHFYDCRIENGVALLKSGVDFQQLTVLKITLLEGFKPQFQITTHDIFEKDYPEDPEVAEYVKEVSGELEKKMGKTVANLVCEIDTRTPLIRRKESPIGNLIADALNGCSGTDLAFINGGSIRSDAVYPAGHFKLKDLMSIFPFEDVCVGIEVTGQDLMDALENSVSRVPEEEGKFPVLSGGVKVVFDSSLEPGSRIKSAELNGEPIDLLKTYKVATKAYMNDGKDGYTSFMNKPYVIDHESGQMLSTVFRNYLRQQQVVAALQETQEQKAVRLLRKEKGFYAKLNPVVEGRIVDLNEKQ